MIIVYPFLSSLLALSLSMEIELVNAKEDQTQRDEAQEEDWFVFSVEHLNFLVIWCCSHSDTYTASLPLISCLILSPDKAGGMIFQPR